MIIVSITAETRRQALESCPCPWDSVGTKNVVHRLLLSTLGCVSAVWKLPRFLELHWAAACKGVSLAGIKQLQVQFSAKTPEAAGQMGWP